MAALQAHAAITTEPWGTTRGGDAVHKVTLDNELGMRVSYIDFGATITAIEVPDRQGRLRKRNKCASSTPRAATHRPSST
jgi:hypothetical protein